jgi:glycerate 2-kinase
MPDMKKILVAPNSFKESASSIEIAAYFQKYLNSSKNKIIIKPISDGGDGFLNICQNNFNLEILMFNVPTPFMNQTYFNIPVGYSSAYKTIFVESAEILGLKKIPFSHRHPLKLSSYGLGELLKVITQKFNKINLERIVIGIGGTGTIDMGIGILSSIGLKLIDQLGNVLTPIPLNFIRTAKIIYPTELYPFDIELILDVNNHLIGENGGVKTFGVQKGATNHEIIQIEDGIKNLLSIIEKDNLINMNIFLSGAGGGIPAGLSLFLNVELVSSVDFILDDLNLRHFNDIDYLITGEGRFDSQSYFNKGAGILINHFKNVGKIFLCCGIIDNALQFPSNIYPIQLIDFFKDKDDSMNNIEKGVDFACSKIQQIIS